MSVDHGLLVSPRRSQLDQVSISSTLQIFRTNVISAAFSSYVLAFAKKLYKKCALIMLMKLTTGSFPIVTHV